MKTLQQRLEVVEKALSVKDQDRQTVFADAADAISTLRPWIY